MARYLYEVELRPDEDGYSVRVPDLDGCFTQGSTVHEALSMAADALMTYVAALLENGNAIPEPTFGHTEPIGGKVVALSFETDADYVIDAVSPAEAAVMLGVSRGRVSQMMRDGILDVYEHAGERKIDLVSINARLASPHNPGRPRMEFVTV